MAEAVVSMALETLRDLLLEEAKFLHGVSSQVKGLETQLKEIKCLLEDADKRQHESKTISNWVSEIRDLAHRAEDTIETYAVQISSTTRGPGFKKLLPRISCLNECFSLHQIGSEISEIKSEIARIKESMKEFGIRSIIQGEINIENDNQRWKRQTYPIENEDCFVGKEDDLKKLVSLVVDDKQQRVIAIWGMGGIGKTTIARKVYNDNDTKRSFECFAWVCITQQCQIRSVLEDVLKQLIPQKGDAISSLSNTQLIEQLCQIQKTKRCMIVLDDLWEVDHFNGLKNAFLVQGSNSKVLVTTRKQNVADMGFAFELGLLKIDDGWQLLKKKAFPFNNIPDNFRMEEKQFQEIGKEMVRKCGYLPLVISILGGLLSKRKSMEEWESVHKNINAHLYREENEIHGVLNLSYEDLAFYLKPCFLSMGQFREDEAKSAIDLLRMWIAEGMISHQSQGKDETLMDIAEDYLRELVSRCLVQVELFDVKTEGKYEKCQLHDAVRELCLSKGKKEGFSFHVMSYRGGEFSSLLNKSLLDTKPRHLAIHFEGESASKPDGFTIHREETSKHVRSLQFLNEKYSEKIEFQDDILDLEEFKLLRVLVFQGFRFKGRQLRGIGKLIHLRYLTFRACELDNLPSSISNLNYLQTLNFFGSWDIRVPNVLKNMPRLKHLILPIYDEEKIGNYHLKLEGLVELETLYHFNTLVHDLEAVIRLKNLIYIDAEVYDNKSLLAIINASVTNWTKLRSFLLEIHRGCQLISTEEGLMILKNVFSCQILHRLKISVPIKRLQLEETVAEIITSRLVRLYLCDCEIEDDPMEILGMFPVLEFLWLSTRAFVGKKMKCHALGFPNLQKLKFKKLPNLGEWIIEQGAMPFLSEIEIKKCLGLERIPDGLRFILNLQKLTIIGMSELGKGVDNEEGENFDKVRHVPSIIIET